MFCNDEGLSWAATLISSLQSFWCSTHSQSCLYCLSSQQVKASNLYRHLLVFSLNWKCGHKVYPRQTSREKHWLGFPAQTQHQTNLVTPVPAQAGLCWLAWGSQKETPWLPAPIHTSGRPDCSVQSVPVYTWFGAEFRAEHGKMLRKSVALAWSHIFCILQFVLASNLNKKLGLSPDTRLTLKALPERAWGQQRTCCNIEWCCVRCVQP